MKIILINLKFRIESIEKKNFFFVEILIALFIFDFIDAMTFNKITVNLEIIKEIIEDSLIGRNYHNSGF